MLGVHSHQQYNLLTTIIMNMFQRISWMIFCYSLLGGQNYSFQVFKGTQGRVVVLVQLGLGCTLRHLLNPRLNFHTWPTQFVFQLAASQRLQQRRLVVASFNRRCMLVLLAILQTVVSFYLHKNDRTKHAILLWIVMPQNLINESIPTTHTAGVSN